MILPGSLRWDVPVDPDADQAREWLARELSKPEYRPAQTTWFDDLVSRILDWLGELFSGVPAGAPSLGWGLIVVVLIGLIVAAYLIFGPPRLNRRSAVTGALFGDDDARDAAAIRRAAELAAAQADWATAIEEMFRALARSLAERAILTTLPGTTANGFAVGAGGYFPDRVTELAASARLFDGVRYLGQAGTEAQYAEVDTLEKAIRATKPRLDDGVISAGAGATGSGASGSGASGSGASGSGASRSGASRSGATGNRR